MATPLRRCRVCRTQHPKAQLHRFTISAGVLVTDPAQRAPGRGYYSCDNARCRDILPRTIKGLKKD